MINNLVDKTSTKLIRCFISIQIDDTIKSKITKIQYPLFKIASHLTLVKISNMHITLKFLGEISQEQISLTKDILNLCSNKFSNFKLKIEGVGAFPKINTPKIIWVGVRPQDNTIFDMQNFIEEKLYEHNIISEKEVFSPHITIARNKNPAQYPAITKFIIQNENFTFGEQFVDSIELNKSELTSYGPIYTSLHYIKFK